MSHKPPQYRKPAASQGESEAAEPSIAAAADGAFSGRPGRRTLADRQVAVLQVLSGKARIDQVAARLGDYPKTAEQWRDQALAGINEALLRGDVGTACEREIERENNDLRETLKDDSVRYAQAQQAVDKHPKPGPARPSRSRKRCASSQARARPRSRNSARFSASTGRRSAPPASCPATSCRCGLCHRRRVAQRRIHAVCSAHGLLLALDRPNRKPGPRSHVTVPEPNRRWATDLTTLWTEQDGLCAVTVLVDCGDRFVLRVLVSKSQQTLTILAPERGSLRKHFGASQLVPSGLELRTDHGPLYTGSDCKTLCEHWRVEHTLAPVGRPTGNAVAERTIRTMKEECIWLADFASAAEFQRALDGWPETFNTRRPHQALGWQTPAERRAGRPGVPQRAAV